MPRVVLVLPTYLPESFGGAEQQSRKLALALSRLGSRVLLLAPRLSAGTAKTEREGDVSVRRFRVRRAPNLGGRHIGSLLMWTLKLTWWLARNRAQYDVIHIIHGRLHALPAVLGGAWLRKPTLIKIGRGGQAHFDLDLVHRKRLLGPWYSRLIVRHATGWVANSGEITGDLRRWRVGERQIHRVPNGVEIPEICGTQTTSTQVRFVYLGRLDREKALDTMIRGFAGIPHSLGATLRIVGEGVERTELEALVRELQLEARVQFTGAVADVAAELRDSDVYVSTSVSEGMSNSLLEAMSFAVMPLVSRVSGVADIVEHGKSGLLFAPGDAEAFAAALLATLSLAPDERRAMGRTARATVTERFGIEQVARRHIEIYNALSRRSEVA